jgi:predicted nuclease of predicted toxin-antitoxin system
VRLLFDQNLSHELVRLLGDLHPDSVHVREVDLRGAMDQEIWAYAIEHHYAIVSKDQDFAERALLEGPPPKVIWIRLGNCSTSDVEQLFREHEGAIRAFARDEEALLALA